MSDSEDELNFPMYGNLLPPFEEDEIPTKKPLNIEDQVATDAHGRRRFHGAFTGGFSAGFCNTVGSLEGWTPKNFKSSRSEKAGSQTQRPEDFMDDEDRAIFGFAPETTITTKDYNSANTRKRQRFVDTGPIPGQCVLKLLLEPAKETIGVKLLKQMGWRPGQGVGPRLTSKQKKKLQMKKGLDVSDDDSDTEVTFAPDDFDQYVCTPKVNTFGMGYIGLSMDSILGAKNKSEHFTMVDHKNKKISIKGQAFGVGAFEEDDEDIYAKEDMSSYDFELGATKSSKALMHQNNILDNFVKSSKPISVLKYFPPPVLPKDYVFEHRVRRTRFEPLSQNKKQELKKFDTKLDAEKRSALINDAPKEVTTPEVKTTPGVPRIIQHPLMVNKFVSSSSGSFKPFAIDPEKQERYDKYVELAKKEELDKYEMPITLNEWERSREMFEFEQAYQMFQPKHGGMVFDRFVEAEQHEDVNNLVEVQASDIQNAAKMKMFGKLTREETPWHPHSLLYKRFNIAEPLDNTPSATVQKKKTFKTSNIFDFINASVQNQTAKPVQLNNVPNEAPKVVPINTPVNTSPKTPETIQSKPIDITSTPIIEISFPKPMEISPTSSTVVLPEIQPEPSTSSTPRNVIPEIQEGDVLHTETKIDLYKAIFLSSDEEDSESEEEPEKETFKDLLINEIQPKKSEIQKSMLDISQPVAEPKGIFAKAPVVKPTGIFANVDLSALNQKPVHKFTPKGRREVPNGDNDIKSPENVVDTFGPKPKVTNRAEIESLGGPNSDPKLGSVSAITEVPSSLEDAYGPKLPNVIPSSSKSKILSSDSSSSEDQWVEKKVKKHKKKSKHKKKKESHRKHKKSKRSKEK